MGRYAVDHGQFTRNQDGNANHSHTLVDASPSKAVLRRPSQHSRPSNRDKTNPKERTAARSANQAKIQKGSNERSVVPFKVAVEL